MDISQRLPAFREIVLLHRGVAEVVDRACLRRETDVYLIFGNIRQGIPFLFYLFQRYFGSGVELELEDIPKVSTFQDTVDVSLARFFFNDGVVFAAKLRLLFHLSKEITFFILTTTWRRWKVGDWE